MVGVDEVNGGFLKDGFVDITLVGLKAGLFEFGVLNR